MAPTEFPSTASLVDRPLRNGRLTALLKPRLPRSRGTVPDRASGMVCLKHITVDLHEVKARGSSGSGHRCTRRSFSRSRRHREDPDLQHKDAREVERQHKEREKQDLIEGPARRVKLDYRGWERWSAVVSVRLAPEWATDPLRALGDGDPVPANYSAGPFGREFGVPAGLVAAMDA